MYARTFPLDYMHDYNVHVYMYIFYIMHQFIVQLLS